MDTACDSLSALVSFRASLYSCFSKRSDALFELTDAMLTVEPRPSPVHLSLEPAHRRGRGSLYAALSHGTVDTSALQVLLARHPLSDEDTRVYAVDCSVWARCDAEASPDRGYYYHPYSIGAVTEYHCDALTFRHNSLVQPLISEPKSELASQGLHHL